MISLVAAEVAGRSVDGVGVAGFALAVGVAVLIGKMLLAWLKRLLLRLAFRHALYVVFSVLGWSLRDLVPARYQSVVSEGLALLPV